MLGDVLIAIGGTKGEIYERKMYRAAAAAAIAKTSSKGVRLITYTSILFNSREKTVGGNQKYSTRKEENSSTTPPPFLISNSQKVN